MPLILILILAFTCIVSCMAFKHRQVMHDLILWPPAVSNRHEYYRLLTYGLVHADVAHLLFNMITLFFFGRVMAPFYDASLGMFGFGLFYLGGLLVSILPTYLAQRKNANYYGLGASGAVSAVLFGYVLLAPWSRIIVLVIPLPAIVYAVLYIAYSIYMDQRGQSHVNHSAHLWGAAYGVGFTMMVDARVLPHFFAALSQPGF